MRARLEPSGARELRACIYDNRNSGVMNSLTWADVLVVIPEGKLVVPDDRVDQVPFLAILN